MFVFFSSGVCKVQSQLLLLGSSGLLSLKVIFHKVHQIAIEILNSKSIYHSLIVPYRNHIQVSFITREQKALFSSQLMWWSQITGKKIRLSIITSYFIEQVYITVNICCQDDRHVPCLIVPILLKSQPSALSQSSRSFDCSLNSRTATLIMFQRGGRGVGALSNIFREAIFWDSHQHFSFLFINGKWLQSHFLLLFQFVYPNDYQGNFCCGAVR